MRGRGNDIVTLAEKLYFMCIPTSGSRSRYLMRHKNRFHHLGTDFFFQPRKLPADPELISIGNNVKIASDVTFVNHDIIDSMLNYTELGFIFDHTEGCIEIGNNVAIGTKVTILPNVKIGSNVIIGAGAIVTKDIPDNSVATGIPCRVIDSFDNFIKKRKNQKALPKDELWTEFERKHKQTD